MSTLLLKEVHFFDDDTVDWQRSDFAAYEHRYGRRSGVRVDCTPSYIYHPEALQRVRAYNPDARVLVIFRDPIARAYSHWKVRRSRGVEDLDFLPALLAEKERLSEFSEEFSRGKEVAYVGRGRYGSQLRSALQVFPRDRIHCILFDDLVGDHRAVLSGVAAFLGIRRFPALRPVRANVGPSASGGPGPAARELISAALGAEMQEFARLSGLDISAWGC